MSGARPQQGCVIAAVPKRCSVWLLERTRRSPGVAGMQFALLISKADSLPMEKEKSNGIVRAQQASG